MELENLVKKEAIELLKKLIACPSLSKQEEGTARLITEFFSERNIPYSRKINNIWARNQHYQKNLPTILLNSHHDTVKPNPNWTKDPYFPLEENGKLYGLGSNDAGASLVSLMAVFMCFYYRTDLKYNLVLVASAEEEITGINGLELLIKEKDLPPFEFAIVGEPTQMQLAIAEKGLMVVDCTTHGIAGHAAREEGENAIYKALEAINWVRGYTFPKVSALLGPVKMSVTIINAGSQHNVVPNECKFTIDVRVNECYELEEILQTIKDNIEGEVVARSTRLKPSSISEKHPIVLAGQNLGLKTYGSPTTSDQAVLTCPSLKCGPGDSARSHTADEYIELDEINDGITLYLKMLKKVIL
jgi:acetylornithine deacetylase